MNIKLKKLLFISMIAAIGTGCSNTETTTENYKGKEKVTAVMGNLTEVELYWQPREPEETAKKVTQLLQMILGDQEFDQKKTARIVSDNKNTNQWISVLENEPGILVKVIPDYDEIRVINVPLSNDHTGVDIGEKEAVTIATRYMKNLAKTKSFNRGLKYDYSQFQVGQSLIGEGSINGKVKNEFVTEYRVTFRPNIDGIELANAGVRLAIHRSGKLSGIRIGGVSANMNETKKLARTKSDEAITKQFKQSIPSGLEPSIAWERIMYVISDDKPKAMVQPLKVYSYSLVSSSDGVEVISRRKTLGFSLTDSKVKPVDFAPSARKHIAQKTTRDPKYDEKLNEEVQAYPH